MKEMTDDMSVSEKIKLGMTLAIKEEIERKHKLGEKYAVMRNGKILIIDPVTGEEKVVEEKKLNK